MLRTVLALALAASVSPAFAQEPVAAPRCMPVNDLITTAKAQYNEVPFLIGKLGKEGYFMFMLSAVDGSSWTIVAVGPDEVACLVATGKGLKPVAKPSATPPVKSKEL